LPTEAAFLLDPVVLGVCFAVGIGAGFLAGYVGLGGGALICPLLAVLLDAHGVDTAVAVPTAIATSVACTLPTALLSAVKHRAQGTWHPRAVLPLGLPAVVTSFVVAQLAVSFAGPVLTATFASLLFLVAIRMMFAASDADGPARSVNAGTWFVGGGAGALASLVGVGGGIVFVPYLRLGLRVPGALVAGTSCAAIVLTASSSSLSYMLAELGDGAQLPFSLGYVNILLLAAIVLGSVPSARLFARLGRATHPFVYRVIVSLILVASSARIMLRLTGVI
jgi:uncharacterized membrane protein YfcA